jgi:hypothetical protein
MGFASSKRRPCFRWLASFFAGSTFNLGKSMAYLHRRLEP